MSLSLSIIIFIFADPEMIEQKFTLERCRRNVEGLQEKIELKFYQAITYFERYDERAWPIIEQIAKKSEIFLRKKLNKVSFTVQHYIQALLFQIKHSERSEQIIAKWSLLQNQNIFIRPYLQISSHYERLGNQQKAIEYCSKCLQMFQKNDNAYYYVGKRALEQNNTQQGINLMKIGLEINRSNINILQTLGKYYEEEKRWNVAQRYYQYMLDLQSENKEKIVNKLSELVEKAHNYKQALWPQPKKQQVFKPMPIPVQIKKPEAAIQKQIKRPETAIQKQMIRQKRELIIKEEVKKTEKSSPKVTLDISPKRKISLENHQPMQMPKHNSLDTLNAADKAKYNHLLADVKNNPQDANATWKLIQFCEGTHLNESIYNHLEPIIRFGKKQAHLTNRICKKMEQLHIKHPENHRRLAHLFSLLRQFHKKSIFVYLYEVYIAILQDNRPKAIEASSGVNLSLFVDEVMLQEKQKNLFKDYAFLFGKLISCENIDLISLSDLYKSLIDLFERSLNKQEIIIIKIIMSLVQLKNLLVSSKQYQIKNITLLYNTQIRFINQYSSDIFIKDDSCFIIIHKQDLQRHLNTCDTIIIFPQQLALINELLQNRRKKFNIFVIKISEFSKEDEVYIAKQCQKLRNFRRIFIPNVSFSEVYQHLLFGQQK